MKRTAIVHLLLSWLGDAEEVSERPKASQCAWIFTCLSAWVSLKETARGLPDKMCVECPGKSLISSFPCFSPGFPQGGHCNTWYCHNLRIGQFCPNAFWGKLNT